MQLVKMEIPPELATILLIAGLILLGVAIFGGGKIKVAVLETDKPMSASMRVISGLMGATLVFFTLGNYLLPNGLGPASPTLTPTGPPTPAETPTEIVTPKPVSTLTPFQTILLSPEEGATVHNANQPVNFKWEGRLADDEQYVLIIYHWNKDCDDVLCTDVHWIEEGSTFRLSQDQYFLWQENTRSDRKNLDVTWQVMVVDKAIPHALKLEDKLPPDEYRRPTSSERRTVVITR